MVIDLENIPSVIIESWRRSDSYDCLMDCKVLYKEEIKYATINQEKVSGFIIDSSLPPSCFEKSIFFASNEPSTVSFFKDKLSFMNFHGERTPRNLYGKHELRIVPMDWTMSLKKNDTWFSIDELLNRDLDFLPPYWNKRIQPIYKWADLFNLDIRDYNESHHVIFNKFIDD